MVAEEHYDIVVIGAGIHGAGVAQAAAAAGHKVLVLEQNDVAAGTSSRSSKLIHGGLRYLETGQWRLVRECLRERRLLLQLAPGLVSLTPHFIPVYPHCRHRPWQLRVGLSAYALLGGLTAQTRFRRLPSEQWRDLDGLSTQGLEAVYQYWDARTDDAALTRAVIDSALSLGAVLRMPAGLHRAQWADGLWHIDYVPGDSGQRCTASVLINAAGPWVNTVLERITPSPDRVPVDLVQGTHLVVEGQLQHGVYYVEAPRDGRAVFIMPWYERMLVGTTETPYQGDPGDVHPLEDEKDYLLETLHAYFPQYDDSSLVDAFTGLRVLPAGQGSFTRRSRETLIHNHAVAGGRLVTVYGGKLTVYRLTAQRVMERIAPLLPRRKARAATSTLKLSSV